MTKFVSSLKEFWILLMMPPLTKRGILSVISWIYDPLGLLAPAVVELKFSQACARANDLGTAHLLVR